MQVIVWGRCCPATLLGLNSVSALRENTLDSRTLADPGTAAFQVEKYPFYLLNRLVSRYNVVVEAKLKPLGLDIPYWRVLMILGENAPRGVAEVAAAAVIPLSTMTRIIQRMEAASLVRVKASKADARVSEVSLRAAGRAKLEAAREVTAPVFRAIIKGIDRQDFDKLLWLLNHLHSNLEAIE